MLNALFWGVVATSSLILGGLLGSWFSFGKRTLGLIMAFGVGALISAVSFELVAPALQVTTTAQVSLGLLVGAFTFYVGDWLIGRLGEGRKNADGPHEESSGLGIVLGTVLDGIPESAVLGMSLATGDGVSMALLASIWISNFPEALGGSVGLEKSGTPVKAFA